jgi:hypothetical protein
MSLAVIGSGFGRTGTLSLKTALEMLGFGPCHHMEEVFQHPEQVPYWQAIAARKPVDLKQVYTGYRAQVDWPGAHVWREAAAVFPQAKIVHSVRPEESWWKSYSATIGKFFDMYKDLELPPHIRAMSDAGYEIIVNQTLGGKTLDKERALAAYRKREADVRAAIPADRLMVFDVAEGWEPLCRFLGVTVPDAPFPRLNSTDQFWEHFGGDKPK